MTVPTRGRFHVTPPPLELHPKHDTSLTDGLESVRGGWIVQRTDEYVVDVQHMLFNVRVHVALAEEYGSTYLHGYCYFGLTPDSLVRAIEAARQWADPLNTDPIGFDKKAY